MAKTMNVQYTDPVTGSEKTIQVTIDIDRFRKDTEEGDTENFFLMASAAGKSSIDINIDDLIADLIDGRPSHPKHGVVQSLIDTDFSSGGATLSVTPTATIAGFVANIPCVVLDKFGNVVDWFIPGSVTTELATIPASGDAALLHDCKKGWIVQQAQAFASSEGENSELGIKAQAEQPDAPTAVGGTGGSHTITSVHFTKSADAVVAYYDIYVIKADAEPASIEPNCIPTVADQLASAASTGITLNNYFDEDTMILTALGAGTFFIGVVSKDGPGMVDVNESEIAWSTAITVGA